MAPDHIDVEFSLTPGVDVAPGILAQIDRNRDGQISEAEGRAYAKQMLNSVALEVDGHRQPLAIIDTRFPLMDAMRGGLGMIRITLRAKSTAVAPGPHALHFQNQFQTNISQYLVNALVPESRAVAIEQHHRNPWQTEMRIDYSLAVPPNPLPAGIQLGLASHIWLIMITVVFLGALGYGWSLSLRSRGG